MATTTLDELLVGLGFDYDPEDLEKFQKDLDSTVDTIKKLATTLALGTAALFAFTTATTAATDEQGKLAEETGVAVGVIDALQFANKRAGGSADGLSSSLQQLALRIGETARGVGSGIEAFGILGISVTEANGALKTTDQVLLEVSNRFEKLSRVEQIELADKLGLRDSIRLLQQGSSGIQTLIRDAQALGVTTKEDAALSAEFQDSLTDIWQIVKQVSRVITRSLVPILDDANDSFTDWWKINRQIIEQNIPEFIALAAKALRLLSLAALGFISIKLLGTLASLITFLNKTTVAALFLNGAVAILPLLFGAAAIAIALLAEDAKEFFEGGESFIGDMIEKYPQWEDEIRSVAAHLNALVDITDLIFKGWDEIFKLFSSGTFFEDLELNINRLVKDLGAAASGIADGIEDSISGFLTGVKADFFSFVNGIIADIDSSITNLISKIKGVFSFDLLGNTKVESSSNVIPLMQGLSSNREGSASQFNQPSLFSNRDTINNSSASNVTRFEGDIVIKIDGSKSPQQTGMEVRKALEDMTRQASRNLSSAVKL